MKHLFIKNYDIDSNRILFYLDNVEYTYQDIYKEVLICIKKLANIDDKRIAVYFNNSKEFIILFLALSLLKKEVVLINTRLTIKEIMNQLSSINVDTIITESDMNFGISLDKILEYNDKEVKYDININLEDIILILFSSGTTGASKAIPIKWKQLLSSAKQSSELLGIDNDNWLLVLPMYHIGGFSIFIRSMFNFKPFTLMRKYDKEKVLNYINNKLINIVSLVPTMLEQIIDEINTHILRCVLLGGAKPSEYLLELSNKKNIPIYQTYGMTETASQLSTLSNEYSSSKIGSVGLPLIGNDIKIINKDKDGIGEILVKGPTVLDEYLNVDLKINDYFNTGDLGYFDNDGFLYIVNRRKDLIISGGENIYPKEIEEILNKNNKVKECIVVGKKDDKWGEVPILYVVGNISKDEILSLLTDKIASYKIPKEIIFLNSLPRNSLGKIQRFLLKR